jgi:hypothetical protein
MPPVEDGELVYRKWNDEMQKLIQNEQIEVFETLDRTMYNFDYQTFHTATKARENGWRWFGRVSRYTDRTQGITNEMRVNAQVYLEFPMNGW